MRGAVRTFTYSVKACFHHSCAALRASNMQRFVALWRYIALRYRHQKAEILIDFNNRESLRNTADTDNDVILLLYLHAAACYTLILRKKCKKRQQRFFDWIHHVSHAQ